MVTYYPQDAQPPTQGGHPPKECILQTQNLALRLKSQNKHQVTTAIDGHLSSEEWSPPIQNMVTKLPKDVHPFSKGWSQPSQGWSPTNSRMVTQYNFGLSDHTVAYLFQYSKKL